MVESGLTENAQIILHINIRVLCSDIFLGELMRKIYKPLILLTTIMSLSFSVEASEPAQKVNLSKNSENTPTSIGSE